MLINHMDIIIKAYIKITSSKSVKPTKKFRNFYLKKRCKGVDGFTTIFRWSCRKNDGGGGGGDVEVPVERMRVERSVWEKNKNKKKKTKKKKKKKQKRKRKRKKGIEWASQRGDKME